MEKIFRKVWIGWGIMMVMNLLQYFTPPPVWYVVSAIWLVCFLYVMYLLIFVVNRIK